MKMSMTRPLNADFIKGAVDVEGFPVYDIPEAAFSGRSNVGKSTLLNSIVLNKKLAKTSSTPGKTQQINFFRVEDKWSFADLPGFGYAKISKTEREKWAKLNYDYLLQRENLQLVCVLIDSRHDPMPQDLALIELLENSERRYLIVLTKSDKLKPSQVKQRHEQLLHLVSKCSYVVDVLPYSSETGLGRHELLGVLKRELSVRT